MPSRIQNFINLERDKGLLDIKTYYQWADTVRDNVDKLKTVLQNYRKDGHVLVGYGAAAKGNTLLNYAGVKPDLLPFVCDAAQAKQGKYMPGSHIPILHPSALSANTPDYVLILPWNIAAEVKQQNAELAARATKFVTAVPNLSIE